MVVWPTGSTVQHLVHHGPGRVRPSVAVHRGGSGDVHPGLCRLHRSAAGKYSPAQICESVLDPLSLLSISLFLLFFTLDIYILPWLTFHLLFLSVFLSFFHHGPILHFPQKCVRAL